MTDIETVFAREKARIQRLIEAKAQIDKMKEAERLMAQWAARAARA